MLNEEYILHPTLCEGAPRSTQRVRGVSPPQYPVVRYRLDAAQLADTFARARARVSRDATGGWRYDSLDALVVGPAATSLWRPRSSRLKVPDESWNRLLAHRLPVTGTCTEPVTSLGFRV